MTDSFVVEECKTKKKTKQNKKKTKKTCTFKKGPFIEAVFDFLRELLS